MTTPALVLCIGAVVLMLIGVPIAYALCAASAAALMVQGVVPLIVFPQRFFNAINSFPLMAIIFFVVAGELMMQGGISKRLVNFASMFFSWMRGSLSLITFVTCAFFGAISGSGLATSAAIGGIMYPEMTKDGDYEPDYAAAILAVGGTLGLMIPPSIPLILYGTTTGASIGDLFIAVIIPGLIFTLLYLVTSQFVICKRGMAPVKKRVKVNVVRALLEGIPALLTPVIVLGSIYAGICTPTESAICACVYALVIGIFVYRELNFKTICKALRDGAKTSAIIMFMIGAASFFGWAMTTLNITSAVTQWLISICQSKLVFLLIINVFYLLCGMLMETGTVILLVVPLVYPVACAFGVDPIHFGIITNINLAIGLFTPPFGTGVFLTASNAGLKVEQVFKRSIPFIAAAVIGILIVTYIPALSTALLRS